MPSSTAPQLRLVNDEGVTIDLHCPICHFIHHAQDAACAHGQLRKNNSSFTLNSDSSYYTAETSTSMSSNSSNNSITARIKVVEQKETPSLRHKTPTRELSLRELRKKQSQQWNIRTKRSEELLQQVYEAQIRAYLDNSWHVKNDHLQPSIAELAA